MIVTENELMFETTDYEGTRVVLGRITWQTKAGNNRSGIHPEIKGYLEDVKAAIEAPDIVFQSVKDERSRIFYRLHIKGGDFAGKNLVVVIKYINETKGITGYVSTIYISRTIYSKGAQLWPKKRNLTH